jgi:hypothetical protein
MADAGRYDDFGDGEESHYTDDDDRKEEVQYSDEDDQKEAAKHSDCEPDSAVPRFSNNPMYKASLDKRWNDVRSMLETDPNARRWVNAIRWYEHAEQGTALHNACDAGEVEIVKLMLHAGAQQDIKRAGEVRFFNVTLKFTLHLFRMNMGRCHSRSLLSKETWSSLRSSWITVGST